LRGFRTKTILAWVVLTVLTFSFLGTVVGHHHEGNSAAACQVCHFAHVPALQPALQAALERPEFTAPLLLPVPFVSHSDPILSSEASRAPPSA
jgi:hypothetical protein